LRAEDKIFLVIIGALVFFYVYIYIFLNLIFFQFLAEFTAGFLGILVGFSIDRYRELWAKNKITRQITNSLLVELNNNLDLVKEFITRIKPSFEYKIDFFNLFQTNAWNMFSSRLELDKIEVLYDLGAIYYKFELFNSAMKNQSIGGELTVLIEQHPKFLEELEKDIEEIITNLNGLKI
jgi:hypothetical protein